MPLDVFGQIGLVMLIGLETKNAILIVEFGVELREKHGMSIIDSAKEAARQRLRPILMTSFAFVFGVLPMARATGAGALQPQLPGRRDRLRHRCQHGPRPVRHPDLLRPRRAAARPQKSAAAVHTRPLTSGGGIPLGAEPRRSHRLPGSFLPCSQLARYDQALVSNTSPCRDRHFGWRTETSIVALSCSVAI